MGDMTARAALRGELAAPAHVTGRVGGGGTLGAVLAAGGVAIERFAGPYEVTASAGNDIILPTARRRMVDDVTVHPVPYAAVSNDAGGMTVTIGDTEV